MRSTLLDPDSVAGAFVGYYRGDTTEPQPAVVPEAALDKHLLITGQTGSGKSTTATQAIRTTHRTTDGPTIVIDPKGDGWLEQIGRTVYADAQAFDTTPPKNVFDQTLAFDSTRGIPQLPLFDIRPALQAGSDRVSAVETVVEETLTLINRLQTAEETAKQALDLIRVVIRILFDSVTGADAIAVSTVYETLRDVATGTPIPPTSVDGVAQIRDRFAQMPADQRTAIADAAAARVEKLIGNPYLRTMFDRVPETPADGFHLAQYLDQDVLILVDLSEFSRTTQRVVAHVLLWQLWQPLDQWGADTADSITVWIDEVPQLKIHQQLAMMCELGRSHGLTVAPLLQSPRQLANTSQEAYESIMTNIHNVVAGHLDDVDLLQKKLTDTHRDPAAIEELLGTCDPENWLFHTASSRTDTHNKQTTYVIDQPPLPPGDPSGSVSLTHQVENRFQTHWHQLQADTHARAGVSPRAAGRSTDETHTDADINRALEHLLWASVDLPDGASYTAATDTLRCRECHTQYLPTEARVAAAAACCEPTDPADVDVPVTTVDLSGVDPAAIRAHECTLRQLLLLRLVERVEHHAIDTRAFDVVTETMLQLRDVVGLTKDAVDTLVTAGYLERQSDFQDRLYRLPPAGKTQLRELRGGPAPESHPGDPNESVAHIRLVEGAARILEALAARDATPVTTVDRYWSVPTADRTIDVVGRDETGAVVVTVEAERATGDRATAAPADYETMAAVDPLAAVWVVPTRATGHKILRALVDPAARDNCLDLSPDAVPARTTPLSRLSLSAAGCSVIQPLSQLTADDIAAVLDA